MTAKKEVTEMATDMTVQSAVTAMKTLTAQNVQTATKNLIAITAMKVPAVQNIQTAMNAHATRNRTDSTATTDAADPMVPIKSVQIAQRVEESPPRLTEVATKRPPRAESLMATIPSGQRAPEKTAQTSFGMPMTLIQNQIKKKAVAQRSQPF